MIEQYIEKDIIRQIQITECLFEFKKIDIRKLSKTLKVSHSTIKRDIDKILLLDQRIKLVEKKNLFTTVNFCKNITRYELIKKIYEQSHFLRVCSLYLMGECNYLKISKDEYVSVAKFFYVKKKAEKFFIQAGIMTEGREFINNELKYRFVILEIWMRINIFDSIIDHKIYREAQQAVTRLTIKFSNQINDREKYFFTLNIYLSLKRKDKKLKVSELNFNFIYKGILYKEIKILLTSYDLSKDEIVYLATMYSLLSHNLPSYHYLTMYYQYIRKRNIKDVLELLELIHVFEQTFHRDLLKNILFEKAFMKFIISLFFDHSMFLAEKHYFLDEQQLLLCKKIKSIINKWNEKHRYQLFIKNHTIEKFCLQVSQLLLKDCCNKSHIFIVAEDDIAQIAYREWIKRRVNTTQIVIDDSLYYSLTALPMYINIENSIIICERSLANYPFKEYREIKIFPVSLGTIDIDLQNIFNDLV